MSDVIIHDQEGRRSDQTATIVVREKILIALLTLSAAIIGTWVTFNVAFAETVQQVGQNKEDIKEAEQRLAKEMTELKAEFKNYAEKSQKQNADVQRSIGQIEGTLKAILSELKK